MARHVQETKFTDLSIWILLAVSCRTIGTTYYAWYGNVLWNVNESANNRRFNLYW